MRIHDDELRHPDSERVRREHVRNVAERGDPGMPAVHPLDVRKHAAAALLRMIDDGDFANAFLKNVYMHSEAEDRQAGGSPAMDRIVRVWVTTYDGRQLRMNRTDATLDGPECEPEYGAPERSHDINTMHAASSGGGPESPSFTMVLARVEEDAYRRAVWAAQPEPWGADEEIPEIVFSQEEIVRVLTEGRRWDDGVRCGNLTVHSPMADHCVAERDRRGEPTDPWIISIDDREIARVEHHQNRGLELSRVLAKHWGGS